MANDNSPEEERGETNVFIIDGRGRGETLSSAGFEVFITATLALWLGSIYLFVFQSKFTMELAEAEDLAIVASAASALAGLALTFLGLVHQLNPKERFLKLSLGLLTFFLLASTALAILTACFYPKDFSYSPSVSVWFFSSGLLLIPYIGRLVARASTPVKWSSKDYALYLAPFLIPLPVMTFVTEAVLLTSSVLILDLSVLGLLVLTLVFVYSSHARKAAPSGEEEYARASAERWEEEKQRRKHYDDLKKKILAVLGDKRNEDFNGVTSPSAPSDYLMNEKAVLKKVRLQPGYEFESEALVNRVLRDLRDTNQVYHDYSYGYYPMPDEANIAVAIEKLRGYPIVVLRRRGEDSSEEPRQLNFTKGLSRECKVPPLLVAEFVFDHVVPVLNEEFISDAEAPSGRVFVHKDESARTAALYLWDAWVNRIERLSADHPEGAGEEDDDVGIYWRHPYSDPFMRRAEKLSKSVDVDGQELSTDDPRAGEILRDGLYPEDMFEDSLSSDAGSLAFFDDLRMVVAKLRDGEKNG